MNNEYINILIVEPGKAPRPAAMQNTLEAAERIVGGAVQIGCFLPQRVLMLYQENHDGLMPNRPVPYSGGDILYGTFLLCGLPENGINFDSLAPERQKEFQDAFAMPGDFMLVGSTAYVDPDDAADAVYGLWDTMRDGETVVLTKWGGQPVTEPA